MIHLAATAAGHIHAAAFRTGEGPGHAVFLHGRNHEIFIGYGNRTGSGVFRAGGFGRDGRAGGLEVLGQAENRESVGGSLGEPAHGDIARFHIPFLEERPVQRERIIITGGALHIVPLELEGGLFGLVDLESGGSRRIDRRGVVSSGRVHGVILGPAGRHGGNQPQTQKEPVQFHSLSYSSAAQMSGPMPLGSFARTRSLM